MSPLVLVGLVALGSLDSVTSLASELSDESNRVFFSAILNSVSLDVSVEARLSPSLELL